MGRKVVVNSEYLSTGSPEDYTVNLPVVLKNIRKVSLSTAIVPMSFYTIQSGWNTFTLANVTASESGTGTIVTGSYTASGLADAIQTAMNNSVVTDTDFTCTYDESLNKFTFNKGDNDEWTITGIGSFMHRILGDADSTIGSDTNTAVNSTDEIDLSNPRLLYADVSIDGRSLDHVYSNLNGLHSYVITTTQTTAGGFLIDNQPENTHFYQTIFSPPVDISQVSVKWHFSDLLIDVDFQGINNILILDVE